MKKAKNQAVSDNENMLAENNRKLKATQKAENIPSEKIRGKDKEERELTFKKVLYGYDADEVASYIKELCETYESAARIHESKISSMKEELVLSNRERDSYIRKYKECAAKLNSDSAAPIIIQKDKEDKSSEYEAVIAALKGKLERAENEIEQLKQSDSRDSNKALDEYISRIGELEKENREINNRSDALQKENMQMLELNEKYSALVEEIDAVSAQLEISKAECSSKDAEINILKEEFERKIDENNALTSENESFKKKVSELEIENGVLAKHLEEDKEEIIRLKDINKQQAYEYADKINLLESEQAKSKLAMQKELKLHDYYINQAEITLAELTKQMEQVKQSLNDAQSV